jgi:hypothetical protein
MTTLQRKCQDFFISQKGQVLSPDIEKQAYSHFFDSLTTEEQAELLQLVDLAALN